MAELADAADLKSVGYLNREGSSPSLSIKFNDYQENTSNEVFSAVCSS